MKAMIGTVANAIATPRPALAPVSRVFEGADVCAAAADCAAVVGSDEAVSCSDWEAIVLVDIGGRDVVRNEGVLHSIVELSDGSIVNGGAAVSRGMVAGKKLAEVDAGIE